MRWLKVTSFIMALCLLTNTPCDMAYEHTIDFRNSDSQFDFFRGRQGSKIVNLNVPADGYRQEFEVDMHIDDTVDFDYCCLYEGINKYYYFIIGRVQKGTMTNLFVELDVFQTYYYDMLFNESFVDRCHVNRWTPQGLPTYNIEDEGLNYGTMVIEGIETILTPSLDFVICATSPIGKLTTGGGGGGTEPTGGDWQNGIPSKDAFRYLKGWEGFAAYQYNDSGGVATIGYGTTQSDSEGWTTLTSQQPVSEELASKTAWNAFINNYGKLIVDAVKAVGVTEQRQFDALADLAYNAGVGRITNPNGKLMLALKRDINDKAYISDVWKNYIISDAQGNVLQGLKDRREDECNMFFGDKYNIRSIVTINKDGSYGPIISENNGNGWLPS